MQLRLPVCLVLGLLITVTAKAQTIEVSSISNAEIGNNAEPTVFNLTDYGHLLDGTSQTHYFTMHNTDSATTLTVSSIDLSDPTDYNLPGFSGDIAPGQSSSFAFTFNPNSLGSQENTLHLFSNATNAPNFYIVVTGTAVNFAQFVAKPNLSVQIPKPPKAKLNKTTGKLDLKLKATISNSASTASTTPTVRVAFSSSPLLTVSPAIVSQQTITMKPLSSGSSTKPKKKNLNITIPGVANAPGYIFLIVDSNDQGDSIYNDNVGSVHYNSISP